MTVTCDACGQDWPEDSDEVRRDSDGFWLCADYDACTDRSIL